MSKNFHFHNRIDFFFWFDFYDFLWNLVSCPLCRKYDTYEIDNILMSFSVLSDWVEYSTLELPLNPILLVVVKFF